MLRRLGLLLLVTGLLYQARSSSTGASASAAPPHTTTAAAGSGPSPAKQQGEEAPAVAVGAGTGAARLRARALLEDSAPPPLHSSPTEAAAPPADDDDDDDDDRRLPAPNHHLNKKLLPVAAAEVSALGAAAAALFPPPTSPLLPPLFDPPLVGRQDKGKGSYYSPYGDGGEEDEEMRVPLTLALARTLGRLGEIDVAKELYLAMLARQHPFPFCAWQVIFDPQVFTPVLLDTNSVYRLQALHFRTRSDVFRITARFPRVRYFSFQSYDSAGQPLTSLPDFLVRERQCGSNPFTNPTLAPPANASELGTYEIYVTADGQHGYPNELAALRDPSLVISTTTILFRLYGHDPSVPPADADAAALRLWGFVDPPVVERRVMGKEAWERLPPCAPWDLERVADGFVAAEQKYLFPLPPQDDVCGLYDQAGRAGVVDRMYPYGHLETRGVSHYVVYTNKDSNYLYWCDSVNRLGPDFLLVLRGWLPPTPAGLYTEPRIATPQAYHARYVSISAVENMAPSDTYVSVYDSQLERHYLQEARARANEEGKGSGYNRTTEEAWDRRYTVVAAVNRTLLDACAGPTGLQAVLGEAPSARAFYFLPFARRNMTAPRLPGLVYREILARYRVNGEPDASAAYLKSVCDGGNADCHEAGTLAALSERIMGAAYPRIEVWACDWEARRWRRLTKEKGATDG